MRTDNPGPAGPLSGASGFRFAIVFSRFNDAITESLRDGAQRALEEAGARAADVEVVSVPGAFELPQAARSLAAVLDTLGERDRTIIHLYYQDELTQAEIGRRLGYSQMHVSRLLRQAVERLRLAALPQEEKLAEVVAADAA